MTVEDMEAAQAMEEFEMKMTAGYSRIQEDSFINNHPLTTNDSNGPLLRRPPRYKRLPALPPVNLGGQRFKS
jgi:hypothetical protein